MECSLIGYGNFAKSAGYYLKNYFSMFAYDADPDVVFPEYIKNVSVQEALSKELVIIAIPVQYLEQFLAEYGTLVQPGALVFDVCSVKMKPVNLMKQYFADGVYVLGTHPLFGPQSMTGGCAGRTIVVTPEAAAKKSPLYTKVMRFMSDTLQLNVIEMTPDAHDREMAVVQGLNHFIVHALKKMDLQPSPVGTPSFNRLYGLYEALKDDSDALFYTIQRENPFADSVRKRFISLLTEIEDDIIHEK